MRRLVLLVGALCLAGCSSPDFHSGALLCAKDGSCPDQFYCAADGHCWRDGTGPDGGAKAAADAGP